MKKSYYLAPVAVVAAAAAVVTAQLPRSDVPRIPELPPLVVGPGGDMPKPASYAVPVTPQPPKLPVAPPPTSSLPGTPPLPSTPKLPAVPSPLTANPPVVSTPLSTNPPAQPDTKPRPLPNVPPPTSVAGPTAPQPNSTQTLVVARQFVVLKDEKLIEGEVSVGEEKVVVRQGALERPFPKADVLFVGGTKNDVYRFMAGKAPAADAMARFKVARWCLANGMRSQALAEAREVMKLDPKHSAATLMVRSLEESLQKFPESGEPTAVVPPPSPSKTPITNPMGPTLPVVPPPVAKEPTPIPLATPAPIPPAIPTSKLDEHAAEVTPEASAAFATRVQPILANLCADCHAKANHASGFKLARSTAYDSSPETSLPNLRAVAGQLNRNDPAKSPLLVKAATAHGGMKQGAFVGRSPAAFRNLESWVYLAVGSVEPEPVAKPIPSTTTEPVSPRSSPAAAPSPLPPVGTPALSAFGQEAKPLPPPGPNPTNTGEPVDEFDPSVFNRLLQPRQ